MAERAREGFLGFMTAGRGFSSSSSSALLDSEIRPAAALLEDDRFVGRLLDRWDEEAFGDRFSGWHVSQL